MKILLVEDNPTIALQIGEFLENHKWQLDYAYTASAGINLALAQVYDVILLDLNLPDGDGLDVCSKIKSLAEVTPPILMITARDSFEDKAAGFDLGADDYLTKPFDLRELVLRCKVLARRHTLHQSRTLVWENLTLDLKARSVSYEGIPLELTGIGFQILEMLVRAYPQAVSRSYMSHQIWGDSPPESDALKSHIYALRKSLDQFFDKPVIKTILNVGFQLELQHGSEKT